MHICVCVCVLISILTIFPDATWVKDFLLFVSYILLLINLCFLIMYWTKIKFISVDVLVLFLGRAEGCFISFNLIYKKCSHILYQIKIDSLREYFYISFIYIECGCRYLIFHNLRIDSVSLIKCAVVHPFVLLFGYKYVYVPKTSPVFRNFFCRYKSNYIYIYICIVPREFSGQMRYQQSPWQLRGYLRGRCGLASNPWA